MTTGRINQVAIIRWKGGRSPANTPRPRRRASERRAGREATFDAKVLADESNEGPLNSCLTREGELLADEESEGARFSGSPGGELSEGALALRAEGRPRGALALRAEGHP